ncbi:MAG: Flp pilus assembly complex ATPase component TadA [Candidatus Omnitrophica bacterium]|nr:Flp pilus assembly complex ATPase component TadA [Candidatus Omnitrophota bacterium]
MSGESHARREREVIDLLLNEGVITKATLEKAREEMKRTGLRMEKAFEKLGYITEEDIVKVCATSMGLPYVNLNDYVIDTEMLKLIPEQMVKKYRVVPLFKISNTLTVGMVDPRDVKVLDQIRKASDMEMIEPVVVSEKGIQRVLDFYYGVAGSVEEIAQSFEDEEIVHLEEKDLMTISDEAPVVKLVNVIITKAVKESASDIHIEPEENCVRVRNRVDGLLSEMTTLSKKLQSAIISRIKVLSKMDIAESRKPQDGRIQLKLENRDLDIRVSTFPTVHGENVVMRLLDRSAVLLGLKQLGFLEQENITFEKLIRSPNGIVLVTGPTGSGKTSTLYSALTTISSMEKNIVTIEDPVEYELPLIRQTQVNPKADITFANGLRGILRQDPDIIMVGEIRDKETADVAIQASLTGHLVFATLHTNDAPSALARLVDMGIEPFLISSSVIGVLAQRLIRVICDKCKEKYVPSQSVLDDLGLKKGTVFYRGKGCKKCQDSGFKGRTGVFELLIIDKEIRKMVDAKCSADEIRQKAGERGMKGLYADALIKAQEGVTTLEEVLRITVMEK